MQIKPFCLKRTYTFLPNCQRNHPDQNLKWIPAHFLWRMQNKILKWIMRVGLQYHFRIKIVWNAHQTQNIEMWRQNFKIAILLCKAVSIFCLELKTSKTTKPIMFSPSGKLHIESVMALGYFIDLSPIFEQGVLRC